MKIAYIEKKFAPSSQTIIDQANVIIEEYQEAGFSLTLRQIYYQFVSRGYIENTIQSYKRLGSIINDARLSGDIDWLAIEDRTRNIRVANYFSSPQSLLYSAKRSYAIDMWANQDYRLECWIEKDALVGCVENICSKLQVPYMACRGYTSQSEQWRSAQRIQKYCEEGKVPMILYLGDHDPSGIDMTRDHRDRLNIFDAITQVKRLALNYEQVLEFNPPPNPTKLTDSRATAYIEQFGLECWELDALGPQQISDLVENAIREHIDEDAWEEKEDELQRGKDAITKAIDSIKL